MHFVNVHQKVKGKVESRKKVHVLHEQWFTKNADSVNINMTSNDILLLLAGSVSGFKVACGPKTITISM